MFKFAVAAIAAVAAEEIGYYSWNWGGGSTGVSSGTPTFGAAFTGLIDPVQASTQYYNPPLQGAHFVTVGGGNAAGIFSKAALDAITGECAKGPNSVYSQTGFTGIIYDVEEVTGGVEMIDAFGTSFKTCHQNGFKVVVTTSHSAPYQTATPTLAVALVAAWAADENIDMLSPQLYSSGMESVADFAETNSCVQNGCTWDLYKNSKAKFVPSIITSSHYASVQQYFRSYGITCGGYIQWAQARKQAVLTEKEA